MPVSVAEVLVAVAVVVVVVILHSTTTTAEAALQQQQQKSINQQQYFNNLDTASRRALAYILPSYLRFFSFSSFYFSTLSGQTAELIIAKPERKMYAYSVLRKIRGVFFSFVFPIAFFSWDKTAHFNPVSFSEAAHLSAAFMQKWGDFSKF